MMSNHQDDNSLSNTRQGRHLEKFADAGVYHFSAVGDHGLANNFILQVQLQLTLLHHVEQERGDVAGVHLAGVVRNAGGQVDGADDGDSVDHHCFSGARQFAVAAALGGEVDDDRTGGHTLHHVGGNQHRRFFAGNDGGGNYDVTFGDDAGQQLALARVKGFVLRGAVAAGVL